MAKKPRKQRFELELDPTKSSGNRSGIPESQFPLSISFGPGVLDQGGMMEYSIETHPGTKRQDGKPTHKKAAPSTPPLATPPSEEENIESDGFDSDLGDGFAMPSKQLKNVYISLIGKMGPRQDP